MAYASLVSLRQTTDLILNHDKCSISVDEREQIMTIREYVISFLENFPEKSNRLEGKIQDVANEAEDLIEDFMLNEFQMDWSGGLSRVKFGGRLERVRDEICSISGDLMDNRLCDLSATISSSRVVATGKDAVIIGLHGDLIAIKLRLRGESSKLEVVPIVGMGGIGKTTLARIAYDDPLIMEYFDIRAFIQASQDYSAKKFLINLLASIKKFEEEMSCEKKESGNAETVHSEPEIAENECNESEIAEDEHNEIEIAEKVYKSLKGRRYMIVMDDIWSTNAWDDVRNMFPDDNNGSRIMLTTRLSDVASYASSGSPCHEMKFMDRNQSWNLLRQKVFADGSDCPPELEVIGNGGSIILHGIFAHVSVPMFPNT